MVAFEPGATIVLKRLYVDNFRCLTNFELKPGRFAALVGPNGSGKSTVFEVLRILRNFLTVGGTTLEYFPSLTRTRWDTRPKQRIELEVQEPGGPLYAYALTIAHGADQREPIVQEEHLLADGELLYRLAGGEVQLFGDDASAEPRASFPFGTRQSFLPVLEPRPDNKRIMTFKQWLAGIWLFSLRPYDITADSQQEADAVVETGANFVSWYRALVQTSPEVSEHIRNDMAPVIPGLRAIRLLKFTPDARFMSLECEISGRTFTLALSELSEGQRILLVLYTVLRAQAGRTSLLVFDEPDNFVAQREIQPWLSSLRETVTDAGHGTLLVISHHPEVIDYLAADQVLEFWRADDGPARVRELEVDREKGLPASQWLMLGAGNAS